MRKTVYLVLSGIIFPVAIFFFTMLDIWTNPGLQDIVGTWHWYYLLSSRHSLGLLYLQGGSKWIIYVIILDVLFVTYLFFFASPEFTRAGKAKILKAKKVASTQQENNNENR